MLSSLKRDKSKFWKSQNSKALGYIQLVHILQFASQYTEAIKSTIFYDASKEKGTKTR